MIEKIDISGVHLELTDDIKKYVRKKISKLDRYMNKHARKTVHADVKLRDDKSTGKNRFTCEVLLHLPHETLTAKESTLNIFAAIDIVEAKLKNQLKKYKGKTSRHKADRKGILQRVRNLTDRDYWGSQN